MKKASMTMNQSEQRRRIDYWGSTLLEYKLLLIVPAIVGFLLAGAYAVLLRPQTWTARQSFIVRDDLLGQAFKPGRFESQESLKSAQETILEIARRPLVVRTVLEQLGPPSSFSSSDWVDDQAIEEAQGAINFSAPNGAEFGRTEVIVLTAKSSSRERTRKFIDLLSTEIVNQVSYVRSRRLQSMESELKQSYEGALAAQNEAIRRLSLLDKRLGPDVGVMNSLNDSQAGDSPMTRQISEIKTEMRANQKELEVAETVLASLLKVYNDPSQIAYLSSAVISQQPALEKSRTEMMDLQKQLAIANGRFSEKHSNVRSLKNAIKVLEEQIYNSLLAEMAGVESDIELRKRQLKRLSTRIENLQSRLIVLSESRSEHLALKAQVKQLAETANKAKSALAETQSLADFKSDVGLLTPVDASQVASRPDGVGKKVFAIAGMLAGLMIGLGLVMVVAPQQIVDPPSDLGGSPAPLPPRDPSSAPSDTTPAGKNYDSPGSVIGGIPAQVGGAFQHAASSMQHAANAMQLASEMTPAANNLAIKPAAKSSQGVPNSPTQSGLSTAAPISSSSQMVKQKPEASQAVSSTDKTQSPQKPTVASQPVTSPILGTQPIAQSKPASVRPVDLIKSAEKKNEFVRVAQDQQDLDAATANAPATGESPQPSSPLTPRATAKTNPFRPKVKTAPPKPVSAKAPVDDLSEPAESKSAEADSSSLAETDNQADDVLGRLKRSMLKAAPSNAKADADPAMGLAGSRSETATVPMASLFATQGPLAPVDQQRTTAPTVVNPGPKKPVSKPQQSKAGGEFDESMPDQIRKLSESIMRFRSNNPENP